MRNACVVLLAGAGLWISAARANPAGETAAEILAMEKSSLDGWLKGDAGPQLAITDPQITYFHVVVEKRLDGVQAVKELYGRYRGVPLFDSYEIVTPKVQVAGEVAVLTYVLAQHTGTAVTLWNATQVYQLRKEGWRVIHTHWSRTGGTRP